MQELITYFETIPSAHRTMILLLGLVFFWILEGLIPITRFQYKKLRHGGINLFFTLTTAIVNFSFAYLIILAADFSVAQGTGLLQWIEMPIWGMILTGLLALDLIGAYAVHWVEHKVHFMWKFHIIHHSDEQVDASTALRHHPGESVFRAVFTLLAVVVVGAPIWLVMLYQSMSALLSQFNHSNIKLPRWVHASIGKLIVTPEMHRVHHHATLPYTDANYGNIFSIWDRLFGTYAELASEHIALGLDVFDKRDNHIGDLLGLPFDGKRYKTTPKNE